MKILFCGKCFAMRSFIPEGGGEWTYCDCKQMAARWENPDLGTVEVLAQVPEHTFIIGMSNNFLREAVTGNGDRLTNVGWQKAHALATLAPDHVFDAHRRNCWACVLRVGETSDISWHPAQEKVKAGLPVREALFEPVTIKMNGQDAVLENFYTTYDDLVRLSGKDPTNGVVYSIICHFPSMSGKSVFSLSPGKKFQSEAGMIINLVFTGGA